ncbi:MAG TPA: RDD family protein [Saprospiraceae bacterium]|nr:RDD family protein [Saprospiraceae bacterium]HNG90512.1 RDD family protein [Saprospiraceae bacterium]
MENTILDQSFDTTDRVLRPASKGKRFVNYLIDVLVYYVVVFTLVIGSLFSGSASPEDYESAQTGGLMINLVALVLFFVYYTVMEGAMSGKTVGKYLTRTRAVRDDGSALGWDKAALRSLCRMIPFEPLSLLFGSGTGWHDSIPGTLVVEE